MWEKFSNRFFETVLAILAKNFQNGPFWPKWQKKIFFLVNNFFPLILPKNIVDYSKTIFAIFWCLVWLFRGPQNYILFWFMSVFWQFLCDKNSRKWRDPARRLVRTKFILGSTYIIDIFVKFKSRIIPHHLLKMHFLNNSWFYVNSKTSE